MVAHPADAARRNAGHQGKIRHVLGHDRAGGDKSVAADAMATNDGCVGADGGAALDKRWAELVSCAKSPNAD